MTGPILELIFLYFFLFFFWGLIPPGISKIYDSKRVFMPRECVTPSWKKMWASLLNKFLNTPLKGTELITLLIFQFFNSYIFIAWCFIFELWVLLEIKLLKFKVWMIHNIRFERYSNLKITVFSSFLEFWNCKIQNGHKISETLICVLRCLKFLHSPRIPRSTKGFPGVLESSLEY